MLAQVTTKRAFLACAELIGSARGERNLDYVLFIGCTYAWTRHTIGQGRIQRWPGRGLSPSYRCRDNGAPP
jgi:hypothetical protein